MAAKVYDIRPRLNPLADSSFASSQREAVPQGVKETTSPKAATGQVLNLSQERLRGRPEHKSVDSTLAQNSRITSSQYLLSKLLANPGERGLMEQISQYNAGDKLPPGLVRALRKFNN